MKPGFHALVALCAVALAVCGAAATPMDDENPNVVRPTGVPPHHRAKRTHRSTSQPRATAELGLATTTSPVPGVAPTTGASSVIVINAHGGEVLYEKNADQMRPPA